MFDRINLAEDLIVCRGEILARRGFVVSPESIAEAAHHAPSLPRRVLAGTFLDEDLGLALDDPAYRNLFPGAGVKAAIARAIRAARLPEALLDELRAIRTATPHLYRHALATTAVAVRMLLAAVGEARGVPDLAAAALLHDLGMRHVPARLLRHRESLADPEVSAIAAHPLLGAYHLARVLGSHPAVAAARSHHWRCGQGYPGLAAPPSRSIEVVAVASTFAALTQPRAFRSEAFDARGAADVLVLDVTLGHADANTVKLLVHALRGGHGDVRAIRFGAERSGHAPELNRHTPVAGPSRSPV
jgi:hypothetical protein